MANILDDNSVIPSYLGHFARGVAEDTGAMSNLALRVGEVREIITPDSEKSIGKKFTEYTVEVQEKDGNGPGTSTKYAGCIILNLFGSVADIFRYTLRVDDGSKRQESGIGVGAKVAMLCVNGDTTKAVIVGGFRDTGTDPDTKLQQAKDSKEDGHNLFFEFNGTQAYINKNGELQVKFRGATTVDGKLSNKAVSDAEGSTIKFDKNGGIKLATKDAKQFLYLNHNDKKIEILADEEWHVNVNDKLVFSAGGIIDISGNKSANLEVIDNITLKSSGVLVGAATDAWLLANKYRTAETLMLKQLSIGLTSLLSLVGSAAASLTAASIANVPPIIGGAVAAAPFAAAGASLLATSPIFGQMTAAIETFEAQAATYLSLKNKND
jgi:hypothetical protein